MSIFKRNTTKKSEPAPVLALYVPYSNNSRGFKRIKLDSKQADLNAISAAPDPDRMLFELYLMKDVSPFFRISFDGIHLGTMFRNELNAEYFDLIRSGGCGCVSLGLNATDTFLLVRI